MYIKSGRQILISPEKCFQMETYKYKKVRYLFIKSKDIFKQIKNSGFQQVFVSPTGSRHLGEMKTSSNEEK